MCSFGVICFILHDYLLSILLLKIRSLAQGTVSSGRTKKNRERTVFFSFTYIRLEKKNSFILISCQIRYALLEADSFVYM